MQNTAYKPAFHDKIIKKSILIKFAPKNLQNKNFWIQLKYKCFRENNSERIFILLLFTHMKMKKMLLGAFLGMFALAGVAVLPNYANAQANSQQDFESMFDNQAGTVSTHNVLTDQDSAGATGLIAIRRAINITLTLLSTIAVVICMYGGFLMITAAGDEKKYQKGITVLKYAAIGLAIIALSWIIVSIVFWFVNSAAWWDWVITDEWYKKTGAGTQ